jgi:hypothetical protein
MEIGFYILMQLADLCNWNIPFSIHAEKWGVYSVFVKNSSWR